MSEVEATDAAKADAVAVDSGGAESQLEDSAEEADEKSAEDDAGAIGAEDADQQPAVALSVDTKEDEEEDEAISASEPVPSSYEPTPPPLPYGSAHSWCPHCIRQQLPSASTASDDPLALTWCEQAFFACSASGLSALIDAPRFLPSVTSLPPFVPLSIAVIGPPLSGRTTLALHLASTYNLAYISLPSLLASLTSPSHPLHSSLPTLPLPPSLPTLISLLSHAITTAASHGLFGYVLDAFPTSRQAWRAMEERGMGVRRVIRMVAGQGVDEEVRLVEEKGRVRTGREEGERVRREKMEAARTAAVALVEAQRRAQAAEEGGEEGGGEAAEEEADAAAEAATESEPAAGEDAVAGQAAEPTSSTEDESATAPAGAGEQAKVAPVSSSAESSSEQGKDVQVKVVINADDSVSIVVIDLAAEAYAQASAVAALSAFIDSASASLSGAEWRARSDEIATLLAELRGRRLLTDLTRSANPAAALSDAGALLRDLSSSHLAYLTAATSSLGFDVTSLPLSTSYLQALPNPFRSLSSVSFHSGRPLRPLPLTSSLVLYRSALYRLCDTAEAATFLADPVRYADASSLPAEVATVWQGEQAEVWGDGYCPVSVKGVKEGTQEWVLPGVTGFSALCRGRVYRCASEEALRAFLAQPAEFSELQLPSPLPLPPPPPPSSDELLRAGEILPFLKQTFRAVLLASLSRLSQHRASLLYPALSVPQSAQLLLALALRNDDAAIVAFLDDCSLIPQVKQLYDSPTPLDTPTPYTSRYDALHSTLHGAEAERLKAHFDAHFFHSRS